jgi:hypothetical protein
VKLTSATPRSSYVIEIAAMYNTANRLTAAYGMRPDDEFMALIAPGKDA